MHAVLQESAPTVGRWRRYVAISLLSACALIFEIATTRVLSAVLWYHFAFLAVSLAMLGLGVPGVWFSLRPPGPRTLYRAALGAGVCLPIAIAVLFRVSGTFHGLDETLPGIGLVLQPRLALVLGLLLAPFLCLGSAVCVLLIEAPGRTVGSMYGMDLLGAMVGAAAIVPLMHFVPTPVIIAGAGFLPLAAAMVLEPGRRALPAALAVALAAIVAWGAPFRLTRGSKASRNTTVLYERWTPLAHLQVLAEEAGEFTWGRGTRYAATPAMRFRLLTLDQAAATPIIRNESRTAPLEHLLYDVTSVGHQWRRPERVCVIGAGGGRDILTALASGARTVTAIELNPYIVEVLSGAGAAYSGDVYNMPGVRTVVSEGRSFLTHTTDSFDLIQISMIDSWAATSAGAFALSENYLYTTEALRLYLDRLTPNGFISITRWYTSAVSLESPRLALMAVEALRQDGVAHPREHVAVLQSGRVATFLISRSAFTSEDVQRLDAVCQQRGFVRHWPRHEGTPANSTIAQVLSDGIASVTVPGVNISPPTDDAPFFFQTTSVFQRADREALHAASINGRSVALLRWLLGATGLIAAVLYLLPFALAGRVPRAPGFWRGSTFFVCIGLAFMLIEMPWIQRFILYLGHPSYATTVVLAVVLFGAGLGSLVVAQASPRRSFAGFLLLPVLLLAGNTMLPWLFTTTLGWSIGARVAVTATVLAPPSFLMGFAFPMGMTRFGQVNRSWFWAMNGVSSVLASVSSLALAMEIGFSKLSFVGVGLYVVAAMLVAPARATVAK